MTAQTLSAQAAAADGQRLAAGFQRAERRQRLRSLLLILPLLLMVVVFFALPIWGMLSKSVTNPEVDAGLPETVVLLTHWDGQALPPDEVYEALARDLQQAKADGVLAALARRLNYEAQGLRNTVNKTARQLPLAADVPARQALPALDEAWETLEAWRAIRQASGPWTSLYVLAALDLKQDVSSGQITAADSDQAIYRDIFSRTLAIGAMVTLFCVLLGYPLAYWLAHLPDRLSNLLLICVMLPFWTSLIVRTAAWVVLLQTDGLVNRALRFLGLIDQPLTLIFNRTGVIIAMTHVLLPFMILPLYSVMKGIPNSYVRAAVSLGAHPFVAFFRVYVPQTMAGLAAGVLLTFILAIGYYITPALIGGAADQMVSYFIAFYTNRTVNWGMASALGGMLLIATLLLYMVYNKLASAPSAPRR